ncbi:SDR family oxidoreductase [Pantoea sp. ME81]|uniref:SDR family oxidoreductase n=2 Tax=Pantoea TaxID=53335 RepID=UPI0015F383C3|nr:SDR family NAD(P)-dependent oxidoreductase [Pantoea sp. ME81]
MNLSQNTILITGGTSGIGRKLAESLHDLGNRVIVTGRRHTLLDEITTLRPGIFSFVLDINDTGALHRFAETVSQQFPELNVLIANAGISLSENVSSDSWDAKSAEAIVNTNILGVIKVATAFMPLLRRQEQATFMASGSALAFIPLAAYPTYCASKAFLHSWLTSIRHQLLATSVEVLEMLPPYLQTALTGDHQLDDARAMPVDEYINQVISMLESQNTPRGELLLERDQARRWAEREGKYEEIFGLMNP